MIHLPALISKLSVHLDFPKRWKDNIEQDALHVHVCKSSLPVSRLKTNLEKKYIEIEKKIFRNFSDLVSFSSGNLFKYIHKCCNLGNDDKDYTITKSITIKTLSIMISFPFLC